MIVSLNWLKQYTEINLSVDELTSLIGERLVEIEGVEYIGDKYKDVIVAKVISATPIEGTDHLNLVMIDDGGVVNGVGRNGDGHIQVVCGAPNVVQGALVAWLPPETTVPETYGTAEPFKLGARELRGFLSNGMLASARELDLYDDHSGILIIDKAANPGDSFRDLYDLDDYLIDIENKSLTHRPDAFGLIGLAREVSGIQGLKFKMPSWLNDSVVVESGSQPAPKVYIDKPALSDRFQAIVLSNISESSKSSVQMQTYLARSGVRPVNASVDISNYIMLLTGQPSHTYDYDKLIEVCGSDEVSIHVRNASEGEKLVLLDGKEIAMDTSDIVISAGDTAVGLAGAMGGKSTAVDSSTTRVLLEVATFNLFSLRSTQMRHGLFSEAVTRFTKGIPALLGGPALAEIVALLKQYTGAVVESGLADDYPAKSDSRFVELSVERVNSVLGTHISGADVVAVLDNVGFSSEINDGDIKVEVPYWRNDINIAEDIIEEVGRLLGFDTINVTLPLRYANAISPSDFDKFRFNLRSYLVKAGMNEVLTYSFIHEDVLKNAGQDADNSYKIINSISPELQRYRQSLTPSLLGLVHPNIKAGYSKFSLFEINKTHDKSSGYNEEGVPVEKDRLAAVFAGAEGTAYYSAKRSLDYILSTLGVSVEYRPLSDDVDDLAKSPFEPKRSASIYSKQSGLYLGVVGEYKKAVKKAWKMPDSTSGYEILTRNLFAAAGEVQATGYRALSRYPSTERDVCFQVSESISYQSIFDAAEASLIESGLIYSIEPLDIYKPEGVDFKNITIRIEIGSYEKTLTGDEIAEIVNNVVNGVNKVTGGRVV